MPVQKAPAVDPSDPFAEWERANNRVEAQKQAAAPVRPQAPVQQPVQAPAQPVQTPVQPQQPSTPVPPAPAPAPAKKSSDGVEFNLEDILSEFK